MSSSYTSRARLVSAGLKVYDPRPESSQDGVVMYSALPYGNANAGITPDSLHDSIYTRLSDNPSGAAIMIPQTNRAAEFEDVQNKVIMIGTAMPFICLQGWNGSVRIEYTMHFETQPKSGMSDILQMTANSYGSLERAFGTIGNILNGSLSRKLLKLAKTLLVGFKDLEMENVLTGMTDQIEEENDDFPELGETSIFIPPGLAEEIDPELDNEGREQLRLQMETIAANQLLYEARSEQKHERIDEFIDLLVNRLEYCGLIRNRAELLTDG